MVIAAFGALVFLLGAPWIYAHMTEWQSVRDIGVPAMRFLSWYQIPLVIMVVYIYAMRGAGDTRSPMFINTFGIVLIRLPVGALFGLWLGQGLIGAWMGMSLDVTVRAVIAYVWYGREHWAETHL
jgi:MATE family multidrug resistance protein